MFADLIPVEYKWPDEEEFRFGYIIHTDYADDFKAAEACEISDDMVLIYTDTLDQQEIERNFDGLQIEVLSMW